MAQIILTPVKTVARNPIEREMHLYVDLSKITYIRRGSNGGTEFWNLFFENEVSICVADLDGAPDLRPPTDKHKAVVLTTSTSGTLWVNGQTQGDPSPVAAPA